MDIQQDIDLMERIASHDESALRSLYALYGQRIYTYALRLTSDSDLAEDVVQEALVIIWRSAKTYRAEGRLLAWLLGIIHHLALKSLRHSTTLISAEMEETLIAATPLPEESVQCRERSNRVQQAMQTLTPEHRAVLELIFYHGLNLKEAAEVCGCPVGTIKSRLSYARLQLRRVLSRTEVTE